jgi:hypothetical protein
MLEESHEKRAAARSTVARAHSALSDAERVIFLGFGYGRQNVERLQLQNHVKKQAGMYLCVTGFTPEQQVALVRPYFNPWGRDLRTGKETDDIVQFLRRYPEAFL